MEKYCIIYNPHAGSGTGMETAKKLSSILEGNVLEYKDLTEINDYESFFASLPSDEKLVIAGGDGTLNRFVNDIGDLTLDRDIYYYAAGSGNDFMHDICPDFDGNPICITKYLKDLPTVTVNGKTSRFINGVGYGIDGYCCEVGDKLRATSKKPVNYAAIAIKGVLFHYKTTNATVTVDGKEYKFRKVWIAPTMNGRCYGGGMIPTPNQKRISEYKKLSLMLFHNAGKLGILTTFPSIFKGEHVKKKKMVEIIEGKEITVRFDRPTSLQIDGETVLGVTEYSAKL